MLAEAKTPMSAARRWTRPGEIASAPGCRWAADVGLDSHRIRVRRLAASGPGGGAPEPPSTATVEIRLDPAAGSAAAALLAAHWIHWRDPGATVRFSRATSLRPLPEPSSSHQAAAWRLIAQDPQWVVFLSAYPSAGAPEHGWIEPGEPLAGLGEDVWRVRRLYARPRGSASPARACRWDARSWMARTSTVIAGGRRRLPRFCRELARVAPFGGPIGGSWALRRALSEAPDLDVYRDLLPVFRPWLAVLRGAEATPP